MSRDIYMNEEVKKQEFSKVLLAKSFWWERNSPKFSSIKNWRYTLCDVICENLTYWWIWKSIFLHHWVLLCSNINAVNAVLQILYNADFFEVLKSLNMNSEMYLASWNNLNNASPFKWLRYFLVFVSRKYASSNFNYSLQRLLAIIKWNHFAIGIYTDILPAFIQNSIWHGVCIHFIH